METTLYGLNKAGGFKVWIINTDEQGLITIKHGKENGKLQIKSELVKGKNIGRSNETTPAEQAVSEAEGKIKKQKDKGYREDKADLQELPVIAMLAYDYHKAGHRIEFPCYGSDKYDGVRCLAKKRGGVVTLESRTGQPYDVPHIVDQLSRMMFEGEIFDGELYLHGYALQEITSAVKRTDTQGEIDKARRKYAKAELGSKEFWEATEELEEALLIHEIRPQLEFIIFDALSPEFGDDADFTTRVGFLSFFRDYRLCNFPAPNISTTYYSLITDEEELKEQHADAVNRGYEGLMLRNLRGLYESGKRSYDLQKYKTFLDAEFLVTNYTVDKDGCIVFTCRNDLNDLPFNVIFGDKDWKKKAAQEGEKYLQKALTVKFQSRYKGTLLPQFPTGVIFREGTWVGKEFVPHD